MTVLYILAGLIYVVVGLFMVRAWHFTHPMTQSRKYGDYGSWMGDDYFKYWSGRLLVFALWPLFFPTVWGFKLVRNLFANAIAPAWIWFFTNPEIRREQQLKELEAQRIKDIRHSYDLAIEFWGDGRDGYGMELAKLQLQLAESMSANEGELPQLEDEDYYEWRAAANTINVIKRAVSHDERTKAREIARNTSH